ncbi:DUF5819 family protein [Streptomyces sp. NBC_01334]|uniref:DUF5819 family protein n=1 Tax=Streptomyces sp. NBC_01334 TaxID=2903827 RepID=UPI002E14319C|nr:DUF5819 family protein [Streptomyces sp. NBC_01334]
MDVHDGGTGSPQGPNTSREAEAETPPARDTVPRPRAELPSPEPVSRAEEADSEPVSRAEHADSEPAQRAEHADSEPAQRAEHADSDGAFQAEPAKPVGDPVGSPASDSGSDPAGGPAGGPVSETVGDPVSDPVIDPAAGLVSGPRRPEPRTGVAALSPRYQVGAALALAVVAVTVCVHVGMVFLHVAPSNTVTKAHGKAIDDWIYPEFEQNWKLFAPNPLQQNIAVQVRAQVRTVDGGSRTTGWYDLSAQDGRAIDGNLLPSHTQQNELRRAWDFFTATHDNGNRPVGLRGALSETYLRHIVVRRLERGDVAGDGGVVERIQVRSQTTNVTPPKWSTEKVSMSPVYRELSWWSVPDGETEGGAR